MDFTQEISQNEMLERIAELDHSHSQLRDSNVKMRHLLDTADDEIVLLRLDNATLRKQLQALKKVISEEPQVEVEPCMYSAAEVNSCTQGKIHDLEQETSELKEENKQLTEQLKQMEEERDQIKMSLSKMGAAFQSLERGMEEAQLEIQQKGELIHQKDLQLNHLNETMEECSDIIKDLRLTKQQLTEQLEDRREEASIANLIEIMRVEETTPAPQLSIAEEILLASPSEVTPEPEDEELLESEEVTAANINSANFVDTMKTGVHRLTRFLLHFGLFVFTGILLVWFVAFANILPFKPFITLSYTAMPPV